MEAAMADPEAKPIHNDTPIWGASAIGREIGLDRAAAYHLLERGLLPARRIGRRWVSTRGQLRRALGAGDGSEP
jgi:hypothetical protein